MNRNKTSEFTTGQRRVALVWGIVCHGSFGVGVLSMLAGLWSGMQIGIGPFQGLPALVADLFLLAQFPLLHSVLLSKRGRAFLGRLAPLGLGGALGTTTYATIASWQLLATFVLWSPIGAWMWVPSRWGVITMSALYAASWLLLLKAMADAGLGVQTGFLGWGSVVRGKHPAFKGFQPKGTFRWVRQPVYVAFALTLWTGPLWTLDHLLIALGWTAYCIFAPKRKEQRNCAQYGEAFAHYRTLVPYWVPRARPADLTSLRAGGEIPAGTSRFPN